MTRIAPAPLDFVRGDATGLSIPAHAEALRQGGEAFLTAAFQAFGALGPDNRVARITRLEPCSGGSTGHKVFLSVEYARAEPGLHRDLFVKFSRDFTDPMRDHGRYEMESEVRFAALSHAASFPIAVPVAYFADYQRATGTGLVITQRIAFGADGIEPQHAKCWDHLLADPLPYYRAVVRALGRLAAAHRAGRLGADIDAGFPFDPEAAAAADRIRHDAPALRELVARYATFAQAHPQLVPEALREPGFVARLEREVVRVLEHEEAIQRFLRSDPDLVALCHWNAHIDNAWFWRDAAGELQCGLIDWGRVRQLNLAYALWGSLSGAPIEIWEDHLDELLDLFLDELAAHGGPRIARATLRLHLDLYVAAMGVAWMLEAPARILHRLPEVAQASGPHDALFRQSESAHNQLHILTVVLDLWRTHDFGASLDRMLALAERPRPCQTCAWPLDIHPNG